MDPITTPVERTGVYFMRLIERFKYSGRYIRQTLREPMLHAKTAYVTAWNRMLGPRMLGGVDLDEPHPDIYYGPFLDSWVHYPSYIWENHPECPPPHPDPYHDAEWR